MQKIAHYTLALLECNASYFTLSYFIHLLSIKPLCYTYFPVYIIALHDKSTLKVRSYSAARRSQDTCVCGVHL